MQNKIRTFFKKLIKPNQLDCDIKNTRFHFSKRFQTIVESLQAGTVSHEDVILFCEKEPSVLKTIEFLKNRQDAENKKAVIDAIIKQDKPLIERELSTVKDELKILEQEQIRLEYAECYTIQEVQNKFDNLKSMYRRIDNTKDLYQRLCDVREALTPIKKKPGRPHKETHPVIEMLKKPKLTPEEVDIEIQKNMNELTTEQKEIVLNYIKNIKLVHTEMEAEGVIPSVDSLSQYKIKNKTKEKVKKN